MNELKLTHITISSVKDAMMYGPGLGKDGTPYKSEYLFGLDAEGKVWWHELVDGLPSTDGWQKLDMNVNLSDG